MGRENMIKIEKATIIEAAGNKPKIIEEFIGRVNSGTGDLSIAKMTSPAGWIEPGQNPEFDEYTVVLRGMLRVTTKTSVKDIHAGEAVIVPSSEWVQYSTPGSEGAEYIAVCLPAFSPETVHRDE
jgi:mannose-6-phosphate isomerase-like protein (cupin superfamily)